MLDMVKPRQKGSTTNTPVLPLTLRNLLDICLKDSLIIAIALLELKELCYYTQADDPKHNSNFIFKNQTTNNKKKHQQKTYPIWLAPSLTIYFVMGD